MVKKSVFMWLLIGFVCLSLVAPYSCKTVSAMAVLETDVATASDGCTMLGVYGSYYSQAQEALDRINEIRKEACDAGNVPDPRNSSRMLTSSDYVPIKWSTDLESIAKIRAMEGGLAYSFMSSGHNRLNGKGTFSISYNGVSSRAEVLAYNMGTSMVSGINQWYSEKSDWVNKVSGAVTGHYTSMINPNNTYVGLGDFYTEEAVFPNTLAGEFCASSQDLDQTMQEARSNVMQKIEVKTSYITGYTLDGVDTIYTDRTTALTPRVNLQNGSKTHKLWVLDSVTYTSSDTAVATVTDAGVVTGLRNGTTTITARSGNTILATVVITVKCDHAKELISETPSTCTATGLKVYNCEICGEAMEQEIPKIVHEYIYGEADSEGYRTGICSVCGDEVRMIPPTTFTLYWNTSVYGSFSSSFPNPAAVGSDVYCWIYGVNGDSSYQDMVMESTDESVVSVPEKAIANSSNNQLKVLAPGITTLTVYPRYNPSLKKKVVVRIGDAGSVDIAPADVTLSATSYEYNGEACTPSVTVSYHDTSLKQGTDYVVTYENNEEVGTATVVITGNGIFAGTIRKDYIIQHTEHIYGDWQVTTAASCNQQGEQRRNCSLCNNYETEILEMSAHSIVTVEAVPATCTESGQTEYSCCSVCKSVLVEPGEIEATGHSWNTEYTVDIPASATTDGLKSIHCSRCSATKDSVVIPAVGEDNSTEEGTTEDKNVGGEESTTEDKTVETEEGTTETGIVGTEESTTEDKTVGTEEGTTEAGTVGTEEGTTEAGTVGTEESTTEDKTVRTEDGTTETGNAGEEESITEDKTVGTEESTTEAGGIRTEESTTEVKKEPATEVEKNYLGVGATFTVDGITYKVVKSNPDKDEFEVSCMKTTSKNIRKLNISDNVSYNDHVYKVVSVGKKAFKGCKKLKTVSLPGTITSIGERAFYGCTSLKKITIPGKTKKIGIQAFAKCKKLRNVNIKSKFLTKNNVGKQAFTGIHKKAVVKVPANKKTSYKKWLKKKGLTGRQQKVK